MIVGLCSTYREGRLALSAVRSLLECCDRVLALEGPIGGAPAAGSETAWSSIRDGRLLVKRGAWGTDAEKRTAMLEESRRWHKGPTWGVILDGDELLVNAPVLPEYFDALHPDSIGFSLHLLELDGSCSYIPNRLLRLDRIDRWFISSYGFVVDGVAVSMPNVKILDAGEPDSAELVTVGEGSRQRRRPLQGEPFILHRSVLRPPERQSVPRMHEAEPGSFEELRAGAPVGEDADAGGVKIWLPG